MAEAEESPSAGGDVEKVKFPVGFRFKPTLQELVEFYLLPKLLDKPTVPNDAVIEADAYECDPEILTKRYPGGDRPTRRTADNRGRWKTSTGQSKPGKDAKAKKGLKKDLSVGGFEFTENTLAYYVGDPRNETKTKWLMLELTVPDPEKERDLDSPAAEKPRDHMLLNKYVMCRIYKSPLKKWKELENEGGTSSASACDEEVPTSSQSGPAPESVVGEEASALTPLSSKSAGKRPAAEQPSGHAANVPNKRACHQTIIPPGPPGPTAQANGGGGILAPPVGVGAAGHYDYRCVPGKLPPLMQWPLAISSSMQGPVQLQRAPPPPLMYAHNGQPPVQRQPVLQLYPPHRAAATEPNSLGQTVAMRPRNLAAGQPARPPYFPRPPPQQQQMEDKDMMMYQQRVYAQLLAEMKRLQKAQQERAASCAGQQQITLTPSTQPACFNEGANHPAGAKFMVPLTQFPAPHHNSNFYPRSGVQQQQQQQQQQSSPAIPAPAADDAPGNKPPMQGDANEGGQNGDCCDDYRKKPFADFGADLAAAKNGR